MPYQLSDRYVLRDGRVFMSGVQALARIPIEQLRIDRDSGIERDVPEERVIDHRSRRVKSDRMQWCRTSEGVTQCVASDHRWVREGVEFNGYDMRCIRSNRRTSHHQSHYSGERDAQRSGHRRVLHLANRSASNVARFT